MQERWGPKFLVCSSQTYGWRSGSASGQDPHTWGSCYRRYDRLLLKPLFNQTNQKKRCSSALGWHSRSAMVFFLPTQSLFLGHSNVHVAEYTLWHCTALHSFISHTSFTRPYAPKQDSTSQKYWIQNSEKLLNPHIRKLDNYIYRSTHWWRETEYVDRWSSRWRFIGR